MVVFGFDSRTFTGVDEGEVQVEVLLDKSSRSPPVRRGGESTNTQHKGAI